MTAKVCLRCDWSGSTASDTCPRCGASLHVGGRPRSGSSEPEGGAAPRETTVVRSRWGVVATIALVTFGVAAVVFVQRNTPATPVPPDRSALGYLVYGAHDDTGATRLWVWNLSASTATPGPLLQAIPTDLLFSYTVSSGWVSVTTPTRSGQSQASVLRTLAPDAQPEALGRGRFVAWLSSGGYLSVGDSVQVKRCFTRIRIVSSILATDVQRSLQPVVCGRFTWLGRDLTQPYITVERGGDATVYRVSRDGPGLFGVEPVLHGYRALSISLNGDLLVQLPRSPSDLYYDYPSPIGSRPTLIGRPGERFAWDRILGWSGDATSAYVLGTLGAVRGIYRIVISPVVEPHSPALLLRTDAVDVSASTTPSGDVYTSTDGTVSFLQDGSVRPLSRPDGAPAPEGPLLWISTLPYSPSVAG